MNIRPEGFMEAGISTSDMDGWVEFLTSIAGYHEIWRGETDHGLLNHWDAGASTQASECLLGCPGFDTGYIRLFQIKGINQQLIRKDARAWDSGGIFDLDIRVPAVMHYVELLHALGWKDFSPQVDWPFGELQVREWLTTGPDAVVLALIQRLAPALEGFDDLASFSHVFNSSQIVADIDLALDFYGKLGFETVLHHEGPLGGRGGEVLGLKPEEAPETPIDLVILHPQGTMAGSVELVAFKDRAGQNLASIGKPYNLGLNLLRFPVSDLLGYASQLENKGLSLAGKGIITVHLEPFGETELFAVRTPDGSWLEFFEGFS